MSPEFWRGVRNGLVLVTPFWLAVAMLVRRLL